MYVVGTFLKSTCVMIAFRKRTKRLLDNFELWKHCHWIQNFVHHSEHVHYKGHRLSQISGMINENHLPNFGCFAPQPNLLLLYMPYCISWSFVITFMHNPNATSNSATRQVEMNVYLLAYSFNFTKATSPLSTTHLHISKACSIES